MDILHSLAYLKMTSTIYDSYTKTYLFFLLPAGHYQYLGDTAPDYANLKSISRRGAGIYRQSSLNNDPGYYDDQYTNQYRPQPNYLLSAPSIGMV